MIYELIDGTRIEGETLRDIVIGMAEEKFDAPRSLAGYRRASASRIKELYGIEVRSDSDQHFVQDLVGAELIRRIS
jgi:hypothetical protein